MHRMQGFITLFYVTSKHTEHTNNPNEIYIFICDENNGQTKSQIKGGTLCDENDGQTKGGTLCDQNDSQT